MRNMNANSNPGDTLPPLDIRKLTLSEMLLGMFY